MALRVYFFVCALLIFQNLVDIQALFELIPKSASGANPKLTTTSQTVGQLTMGFGITAKLGEITVYSPPTSPQTINNVPALTNIVKEFLAGDKAKEYQAFVRETEFDDGEYTPTDISSDDNGLLTVILKDKRSLP